jgi:hypothetical protein
MIVKELFEAGAAGRKKLGNLRVPESVIAASARK